MCEEYKLKFDEDDEPTHLGGLNERELRQIGWETIIQVIMRELGATRKEAIQLARKYKFDKMKWFGVVE